VDGVFLYLVKTRPEYLTIPFVILMIVAIVIPIGIIFGGGFAKRKYKHLAFPGYEG
jgi:membrane protein YdbS with pleckstrin-like domain